MSEAATRFRKEVVERVLHGQGKSGGDERRAAFDNTARTGEPPAVRALVDKVTKNAWKVTDEDVAAAKAVLSEDQVFELCVCAALGQSTRQLESALAALDEAAADPQVKGVAS